MKITLNNTEENIEKEVLSITEIMAYKNFTFKMLVVKLNGTFIPKDNYSHTFVRDGDELVILHLISGG